MSTLIKRNLITGILILTIILTSLSIYNMHTTNTRLSNTVTSLSIQLESAKDHNNFLQSTNQPSASNATYTITKVLHNNEYYGKTPDNKDFVFFHTTDIKPTDTIKQGDKVTVSYDQQGDLLSVTKVQGTTQVTTNTQAATSDNTLTIPFKITHHTNNSYEAVPLTSNTDKPILFFNQSDIIDNKQLKVNDTINAYYIELPGEDQFTKVDIKQSYTPKPTHKTPVTQLKVSTPKQTHHTKAPIIDDDDLSGTESMILESIDNEGYIFSNKNGGSYLSMNEVCKFNLIDLPIGTKVNITFNYNGDITKVDK